MHCLSIIFNCFVIQALQWFTASQYYKHMPSTDRLCKTHWHHMLIQVFIRQIFFACTDPFYCLTSIPMQIRDAQVHSTTSIYPHPFTGVASSISALLLEVSQSVKKQRFLAKSHAFASRRLIDELECLMAEAADLEQRVFLQRIPD
jgi:hypothetical protein